MLELDWSRLKVRDSRVFMFKLQLNTEEVQKELLFIFVVLIVMMMKQRMYGSLIYYTLNTRLQIIVN